MSLISLVVLLISILAVRCHHSIRPGYQFDDQTNMYYKLHSTPSTLPNAMEICEDEDASLFYPRTQEHLRAFTSFVKQENDKITELIIGIHDKFFEGLFFTIKGENAQQALNWAANEPNNAGGVEDCVGLNININRMNDIHCRNKMPFVCERNQTDVVQFNTDCNTIKKGYELNQAQRKCFKLSPKPKNWFDAFRTCYNEGSQLMIVDSSEKALFWITYSSQSTKMPSSDRYYFKDFIHVGLHDLFGEGVFRTLKGERQEKTGYDNWRPGHPVAADKLCGAIDHEGQLLDVICSQRALFVCERDASKEALESNILDSAVTESN